MSYADYAYYYGVYGGSLCEEKFRRFSVRAGSFIDYYTQNRAKDSAWLDEVKMCFCALIDKYAVIETAQELAAKRMSGALASDSEIKSETVGGYSRTLVTGGEAAASALAVAGNERKLLSDTCAEYLSNTGLLYRGGGRKCTLPTL